LIAREKEVWVSAGVVVAVLVAFVVAGVIGPGEVAVVILSAGNALVSTVILLLQLIENTENMSEANKIVTQAIRFRRFRNFSLFNNITVAFNFINPPFF
jgi:hypothetical protein